MSPVEPNNYKDFLPKTSADLAQWISAIGSLLVIIVALFNDYIKKLFLKQNLLISVGSKKPYFEISLEKSDSSDKIDSKIYFGKIKIKIENKGSSVVKSCKFFGEKIFEEKTDNRSFYIKKEFHPNCLAWLGAEEGNINTQDIIMGIPNFIELAKIKIEETLVTAGESSASEFKKYYIDLPINDPEDESSHIKLEKGTYIIPITAYGINLLKPITKYIYLFWKGTDPKSMDVADFEVNILSDKKAKEHLKGLI